MVLYDLDIKIMLASSNKLGVFLFPFMEELCTTEIVSSFDSWQNYPVKPSELSFIWVMALNYSVNYFNTFWNIQIVCFFFNKVGKLCMSWNDYNTSKLSQKLT